MLGLNSEVVIRETMLKPKQGLSGLSSQFPRETYFELLHLIRLWAKALGKKSWSIKIELIFALAISVELFWGKP